MKPKTINYGNSLISLAPDEASKGWIFDDALLLYLLKCVEDRGWKSHLFTNERGVSVCTIVVDEDNEFNSEYYTGPSKEEESRAEVVLYAYVKALASQRKIADGSSWRHFKGDRVDVVGCFPFGTRDIEDNDFTVEGRYWFEESPKEWSDLLCWGDGRLEFQHTKLSRGYCVDRVAYAHYGKGFARLKDDFLGVVGPKYPEMEGCLRFVEIGNE